MATVLPSHALAAFSPSAAQGPRPDEKLRAPEAKGSGTSSLLARLKGWLREHSLFKKIATFLKLRPPAPCSEEAPCSTKLSARKISTKGASKEKKGAIHVPYMTQMANRAERRRMREMTDEQVRELQEVRTNAPKVAAEGAGSKLPLAGLQDLSAMSPEERRAYRAAKTRELRPRAPAATPSSS